MNAKSFFKSKTLWVSLATMCTGVGMFVSGEQSLQDLIIAMLGVVFGLLRLITEEPIKLS